MRKLTATLLLLSILTGPLYAAQEVSVRVSVTIPQLIEVSHNQTINSQLTETGQQKKDLIITVEQVKRDKKTISLRTVVPR
ncbi:MAG: hypothetical protein PHV17_06030 [Candidatus Omnitrophica bacterium]|nr:hypothetical protein [Candidatus Omnitrophota bacterium]